MTAISRAQFLRGDFRGRQRSLRPPWAAAAGRFEQLCDQCGECLNACPVGLISRDDEGRPRIDFSEAECDFCGDCAARCPTGALQRSADENQPVWSLTATIDNHCLVYSGVHCRSCGDPCPTRAIRFTPVPKYGQIPAIDSAGCIGCGACVAVCPQKAVRMVADLDGRPVTNRDVELVAGELL